MIGMTVTSVPATGWAIRSRSRVVEHQDLPLHRVRGLGDVEGPDRAISVGGADGLHPHQAGVLRHGLGDLPVHLELEPVPIDHVQFGGRLGESLGPGGERFRVVRESRGEAEQQPGEHPVLLTSAEVRWAFTEEDEMTRPKVALLGTGIMGAPMARNLLAAGFEVVVWNRTATRAEPLTGFGAHLAASPREAMAEAEVVLTMLADARAVATSVLDASGALCMRPGTLWLQMSTIGVAATEHLLDLAERAGVVLVDAPVVGTKKPAEDGTLVVLAAGPAEAEERCRPLFDAIAARTVWVGEAGAASRLKLVVNTWVVGMVGILSETLSLAEALQVDPSLFLDIISGSALDAGYAHIKGAAMRSGDFTPSFPLRLALKDARLIDHAATSAGLHLEGIRAFADRLAEGVSMGHGDEDMSALYLRYAADVRR